MVTVHIGPDRPLKYRLSLAILSTALKSVTRRNVVRSLGWILVGAMCLALAITMLVNVVRGFLLKETTFQCEISDSPFSFPAVTVCRKNPFTMSDLFNNPETVAMLAAAFEEQQKGPSADRVFRPSAKKEERGKQLPPAETRGNGNGKNYKANSNKTENNGNKNDGEGDDIEDNDALLRPARAGVVSEYYVSLPSPFSGRCYINWPYGDVPYEEYDLAKAVCNSAHSLATLPTFYNASITEELKWIDLNVITLVNVIAAAIQVAAFDCLPLMHPSSIPSPIRTKKS